MKKPWEGGRFRIAQEKVRKKIARASWGEKGGDVGAEGPVRTEKKEKKQTPKKKRSHQSCCGGDPNDQKP